MSKTISAATALALSAGIAGNAVANELKVPVSPQSTVVVVSATTKEGLSTFGTYWMPGCIQGVFTYIGKPREGADMQKILTEAWQVSVSGYTVEDIVKDGMNRIFSGKVRGSVEAQEEAMGLTPPDNGAMPTVKYEGWRDFSEGACAPKP